MATTMTEKYRKFFGKQVMKENIKLAPKVIIGGHELIFDLDNSDDFANKAREELREQPEIVTQSLKELRKLIAGEPNLHVPDDDEFYQMFLRPCKWYAKSAFSLMKRYFRFYLNYPHIFVDMLPSKERITFESTVIYPLPLRNKDGCRILIVEGGKRWKPKEVPLDKLFKVLMFTLSAAILEPKTQIAGARVIIDMEGLYLSQVTYFTPSFAKMVVDFVQKCLPARLKSIHIVNQPFIFNMVFAFFKPFLEEKIRKRIHFHGTNRESLMTFFDKRAMLSRHGGELECNDSQFGHEIWQLFCSFEDIFEAVQEFGYPKQDNAKS